jgi:D-alanyl-lipoteichoic acid acyltransferase DltB (MBOAT superfamily)
MLFNSFQFLIFYLVLFPIYFALPPSRRWMLLLAASLYFYAAYAPINMLLLMITLIVDYLAGRGMERAESRSSRLAIVGISLATNLGILFTYKYLGFVVDSINAALSSLGLPLFDPSVIVRFFNAVLGPLGLPLVDDYHLALPVGISFYTFQSMSYVLDAYRRDVKVERNPLIYFTYVTFFPQLVAGPIERADNLLPQFHRTTRFEFERIRQGLQIALWGMFKKVVIADSISSVVNTVYADPERFSGPSLFVATLFFAIQIYCDFSGYSDIAIGVAKMLGFDLMTNFKQPYLARSIADFWQRWHISLTTWFRDYVYIPLGGNRVSPGKWARNVAIVFLLSGIWHGANWTFVIWGGLHAIYFLIGRFTEGTRARLITILRLRWIPGLVPFLEWALTMLMVLVGWVFFRAANVGQAVYVTTHMFDFRRFPVAELFELGLPRFEMTLAFAWIIVLMAVDYCLIARPRWAVALWRVPLARHVAYQLLFWGIAFFGVFERVEFIYFAF